MAVRPDGTTTCPKRRISSDLGDSLLPSTYWGGDSPLWRGPLVRGPSERTQQPNLGTSSPSRLPTALEQRRASAAHRKAPSAHLRKKPSDHSIRLLSYGANSSLKNSPTSQLVHGLPMSHSSFTTNSPLPRMALKASRSSCAASIGDHLTTRFLRGVN